MIIPMFSFSQNMRISGNVQDTTEKKPLYNALAMVVRIRDSVLLDFKRTDLQGNFSFELPIDTVQLVVSHPKFSDNSYYLFGSVDNKEFDIKRIILPEKSQQLKEVVIYAYKDPVYYKGDTLVYVADSFATKPNAVVEDLLKKLPGIKVNADGSIQAQGKDIQQVLVDGDEFFGADPTMATRNLGAKGVETVEIYEKKNENSTDDTETIQVLDLKLKDDAKKGYFGKASFGTDANKFYEGEFLANKFNKKQKISFFALASNTMKSSLEWRDMYKYGMATWDGRGDDDDNFSFRGNSSGSGDGIPNTFKTGAYFDEQITPKTKLGVNYTYNNSGLKTQKFSRSQYFLTDTTYVTDLDSKAEDKSESHELNIKLTQKLDSLTTLEFEPKLKINKSVSEQSDLTNFISERGDLSRYTNVINTNDANGTNLATRLALTRNFKKKSRKLTSSYRYTYDKNESLGYLDIEDSTVMAPTFSLLTNQKKSNESFSQTHNANISYIEPLSAKFKLEMDYEFYYNQNNQTKITLTGEDGIYTDTAYLYSNDFENTKLQHRIGSQLIFEHKKHRISAGARFRNVKIENLNLMEDTLIKQDINNWLPRARYVYKISQHNRFTLNYNTSSAQPSINQLQPVQDNSNPNRVVIGNPDLKPNFTHSFSGSYNFYKPLSGTHFWSSVNHSVTQNGFANSTEFGDDGRIVSSTINVDGNSNSSINFGGGFPMFKKFLEVFPNVNSSYSKNISKIDGQDNTTINKSIGGGLEIRIERDSFEFKIGGNYDYSIPTSTISTNAQLPYSSQSMSSGIMWRMPYRFNFETDAKYTVNSQRTDGYNINMFIWNASLSRTFLKNENLIVSFDVNDILGQNVSANRFVSGNIITDSRSNIITRYFMGRLTYKFNSTKTKEPDDFF